MPMRAVKVYDGPFPSVEDMMFGDPATRAPVPNETWAEQMEASEIALFCVNFKSQTPVREEDGRPGPRSDQVCRVSSDIAELQRRAQEIVKLHPSIVCELRRKDGSTIQRVSNRRFLWRFASTTYLAIGVWLVALTAFGMGMIWVLRAMVIRAGFAPFALSLKQWTAWLAGGAVLGILALISSMWFSVLWRTKRLHRRLDETLNPDEKLRYEEINRLSVSVDFEERRRGQKLSKEYYQRLVEIRHTKGRNRS
jgi:hypothetical protein